jgi:NAD(P)-dependent dehydrogenase (short-subunit alcohol dehydrogenase family)
VADATLIDRFRLDGKVAIVTGASSGLGVAFAEGLAAAGADLALGARREDRLEETRCSVEALGSRCMAVATDVTSTEDCQRLVDQCVSELGRVDILVNNAGVGSSAPATREKPAEFVRVLEINLFGAYWMAQACGRAMEPGSSVVNIGSILGERGLGLPQAAYSSSKGAIVALTRDLAAQWTGRRGIRVNALAPGVFPSEATDQFSEQTVAELTARIPMGRLGDVEELTAALLFLASDASSYVSGTVLTVDGGLLAA